MNPRPDTLTGRTAKRPDPSRKAHNTRRPGQRAERKRMKKIINGRMYNTDTAKRLCSADNGGSCRDFSHWEEELYQKKTGEFFLYGEGGPASKYSRSCGQIEWCGGCDITPMTEQQAREWMEQNATADEYIEVFGEPEE